jgi:hypothetical protein
MTNRCVDANSTPSPLLSNHLEVQKRRATVDASFQDLISVNILKHENAGLKVLIVAYWQLNTHRDPRVFRFFGYSNECAVMNVNVRNLHA